jgi:hypothetical protein
MIAVDWRGDRNGDDLFDALIIAWRSGAAAAHVVGASTA